MIRYVRKIFASLLFALLFMGIAFSVAIWFFGPLLMLGDWQPFGTVFAQIMWIVYCQ